MPSIKRTTAKFDHSFTAENAIIVFKE